MTEQKKQALETLQQMTPTDLRPLIALTDSELETLIDIVKLHEGKQRLRDVIKDIHDPNQRIQRIIDEMAGKLCQCVDSLEHREPKLVPGQSIAFCISSIFHSKGISISRFDCKEKPKLMPKKGAKAVIWRHTPLKKGDEVSPQPQGGLRPPSTHL